MGLPIREKSVRARFASAEFWNTKWYNIRPTRTPQWLAKAGATTPGKVPEVRDLPSWTYVRTGVRRMVCEEDTSRLGSLLRTSATSSSWSTGRSWAIWRYTVRQDMWRGRPRNPDRLWTLNSLPETEFRLMIRHTRRFSTESPDGGTGFHARAGPIEYAVNSGKFAEDACSAAPSTLVLAKRRRGLVIKRQIALASQSQWH